MHTAPCGDGFNGGNLSNDLKVHDVSASPSSRLQMHDIYAAVLSLYSSWSMEEAERYVGCKSGHYI
jgi:hypothetical protein